MNLLEAIILEMNELGLETADGINVCELAERHNIKLLPDHQLLQDAWKEIKKNNNEQ